LTKVSLIYRKPNTENFSIENVFNSVISNSNNQIEKIVVPFSSSGLINRIRIIQFVSKLPNNITHITGDITFGNLLRKNSIITFHDFEFLHRSSGIKKWILTLFWVKLPSRKAKNITVISQASKSEFLNFCPKFKDKVSVIHNPLCTMPSIMPIEGFEWSKDYILHIGTKSNKNLSRLLEAITGSNYKLVIVGRLSEGQLNLLQQSKVDFKNVFDLKHSQIAHLYKNAQLLSFCSTEEGFGLPIIEAQSLGCPVLTSNISSMPEVAGNGALLVNPYKEEEIQKGINSLMQDTELRNDLIQKGYENCKRFSPEVIAAQYDQLYQEVVSEIK